MNHERDNRPMPEFSDEFLNAFVDNQLALEEKDRVYLRVSQDEALSRRVCELRKIQDMVRLSYQNPPAAPVQPLPTSTAGRFSLGIAASIALVFGVALGWLLHEPLLRPATVATAVAPTDAPAVVQTASKAVMRAANLAAPITAAIAAEPEAHKAPVSHPITPAVTGEQLKVLIHVSSGKAARAPEILDEIENLARYYREQHQNARIEVIINGEGLDLVRSDVTHFAKRIRALQQEYDNLAFAACQNTIDRLKREQGISAKLLPGVTVIDSGVAQIMRRRHQGWAYIQV